MKIRKSIEILVVLAMAVLVIGAGQAVANDVGADFSDYEKPESCDVTVSAGNSIQLAIDDAESGETVCVEPGTYKEQVSLNKELTLIGKISPEGTAPAVLDGTIEVKAEEAILKNMKIAPQETFLPDGLDPHGILVTASGVLVENNVIEGMTGNSSKGYVTLNGIQVWNDGPDSLEDVVVKDNIVRDMHNAGGDSWPNYGGAAAIKVQGVLDGTEVLGNKVKNIHSAGWTYGIVTTHTGNAPGISPENTTVEGNTISNVNDGSIYNVSAEPAEAPYPGTAFCVDGDSTADEAVVHRNNFLKTPIGVLNKDEGNELDATNNYWGHASGPSGEDGRTNPAGKEVGKGAAVVGEVEWNPWLPKPVGKPEKPGVVNPGPPGKKGPKAKGFTATPNPIKSNQQVTFRAQGSEVSRVRVKVFNTVGVKVYDSNFRNGSAVSWNLVGNSGEKLSNGLFIFSVSARVDGEVQNSGLKRLLVIN